MPPKEKSNGAKKKKKDDSVKEKKVKKGGDKNKNKEGKEGDTSKKKKKKKEEQSGAQKDEELDQSAHLEAPPDIGLLARVLERFCCCRSAAKVAFEERQRGERERKAAEEEAARVAAEKARELTRGDIPVRELRRHIRDFAKDFEDGFWPPLMQRAVQSRVQCAAATRIQSCVRRFLGPCRRRRMQMEAFAQCDKFWAGKRAQKLGDKDLQAQRAAARAGFSSAYARDALNAAVRRKARLDAACLVQRVWRGFVGRCIFRYFQQLAREIRERRPKPPKSRFAAEVFQRVWGRKQYVPPGGWPGRADVLEVLG